MLSVPTENIINICNFLSQKRAETPEFITFLFSSFCLRRFKFVLLFSFVFGWFVLLGMLGIRFDGVVLFFLFVFLFCF